MSHFLRFGKDADAFSPSAQIRWRRLQTSPTASMVTLVRPVAGELFIGKLTRLSCHRCLGLPHFIPAVSNNMPVPAKALAIAGTMAHTAGRPGTRP
eukprot:349722-Chlamydomonas_euryale.AAC.3